MSRTFFLALVACLGCAPAVRTTSTPTPTTPSTVSDTEAGTIRLSDMQTIASTALSAPIDSVWRVLPAVYTKLEIAPEVSDRNAAVFGTRAHTSSRLAGGRAIDLLRCPNSGSGSSTGAYRTRISILTTVAELPGGETGVSTEVSGAATSVEGTSTGAMRCASTGEIERRIVGLITDLLKLAR